jgi:hypothetical protein
MAEDEILVIAAPASKPATGEKALLGFKGPVQLSVAVLGENLRKFVESVNTLVSDLPTIAEQFRLEEIELSVEVNAEGNIQLIGGLKTGVSGGLTLKLKRTP